MTPIKYHFTEGDTDASLLIQIINPYTKEVMDLTGKTVAIRFRVDTGPVFFKAMTIVEALTGIVSYKFLAGELTPGTMSTAVVVTTTSTGLIVTQANPSTFKIRATL